jgi:hypothetical protein
LPFYFVAETQHQRRFWLVWLTTLLTNPIESSVMRTGFEGIVREQSAIMSEGALGV